MAKTKKGAARGMTATGEQVVRLAEEWGHRGWLSLAEYGLGQAYFIGGRYREAEAMLGRACAQLMGPDPKAPIGTTAKTRTRG